MVGYEKTCKIRKKLTSISSEIFSKNLYLHILVTFPRQNRFFKRSVRKHCTEDNVLTVGNRGDSYFFPVSIFTVPQQP